MDYAEPVMNDAGIGAGAGRVWSPAVNRVTLALVMLSVFVPARIRGAPAETPAMKPHVGRAAQFGVTPPLRTIRRAPAAAAETPAQPVRVIPRRDLPRPPDRMPAGETVPDPVLHDSHPITHVVPTLFTFEGLGNLDYVLPPDMNGDVGMNHYVEMVNLHFGIFDKTTGDPVIEPMRMSELFAAAGFDPPASTTDDGDPIVLYDHLAGRWLISQFIVSVSPPHEVIGISQTDDPTGEWYLYDFVMPNSKMNDYPHFGVWPDGYYMTDNQFEGFGWAGAGVFAFDRARMLNGDPDATYQYFDLYAVDPDFGGMLPSDLDGPPPPPGTPNYFLMVDDSYATPDDTLSIWEFRVDWDTPDNSTFGVDGLPNAVLQVAPFDSSFSGGRDNIPQPDTGQRLDAIADRLMHRVQYRNFGGYESLVACHTVDADGTDHAGVRYYQLRRALPGGDFAVHEQATFAPDADHRWMGSAAMDANGNLAVGYTVSGPSTYPSVRYAARLATDPPNGLFQGEGVIYAGGGSQTHPAARWGDYSMLTVDPADDVTFWYVGEYLPETSSSGWHTRVGTFRMGSGSVGILQGRVLNGLSGDGIPGAKVATLSGYTTMSTADGDYALLLPTGPYSVVASARFYYPVQPTNVIVSLNSTTTVDFVLSPEPLRVLPATGLNASGTEGGPFDPPGITYLLTNASLSSLTWTALPDSAWLAAEPQGGSLAPGEVVAVDVDFSREAEWLAAGTYEGSVVISNVTDGSARTRRVTLDVARYLPPAVGCFDFSAGLPEGWSVVTNADWGLFAGWRFDDPGGRENLTGGEGAFASVDSDLSFGLTIDTELRTSIFDLSDHKNMYLEFRADYFDAGDEQADVDVSTNGAAGPWTTVWSKAGESFPGPATVFLDISEQVAGRENAMLRFRYRDFGSWGWWWQVDDVCLYPGVPSTDKFNINPPVGLDAAGYFRGPFAPDRLYRLSNLSEAQLAWSAASSSAWCEVSPTEGRIPVGESTVISVRISDAAQELTPGNYEGRVVFSGFARGMTLVRPVTLTVLEPLAVAPDDAFTAVGLEGGPFLPATRNYTLANESVNALNWTARWSSAWLDLSDSGGFLGPGDGTNVALSFDAGGLAPGLYSESVIFSNVISGAVRTRDVQLRVIEITGEIEVFDTVAPTNDQYIPFGAVPTNAPRTESITVMNSNPDRDLVISNIMFGLYREDFEDGRAAGWDEDVDPNWNVVSGEYVAESALSDFMTATYGGREWDNVSFGAAMRRGEDSYWSEGVAFRASADFDADGKGSGYLFLISGNYYAVFWADGPSFGALQGWTESTAIRPITNSLVVSAQDDEWKLLINDVLVWQGRDSRFAGGRIGLVGYTDVYAPAVYGFDDIIVDFPVADTLGMGGKQRYLNARAQKGSRKERADHKALEKPPGPVPAGDAPASGVYTPPTVSGPFSVTNLPSFPATLHPGESFNFSAVFSPTRVGFEHAALTISGNDNDEPAVTVALDGHASSGLLTGKATAAHSGAPLPRVQVRADNGINSWTDMTDTNGAYEIALLVGVYDVAASLRNYATQEFANVVVPADGSVVTQNFALTGSLLTYGPASLTNTLRFGETTNSTVWLTNSGPLDVSVRILVGGCDPPPPVSLPRSDGNFPGGGETLSFGRSPRRGRTEIRETIAAPSDVPCFGIDMLAGNLVSFRSADPGTLSTIGSTGGNLIPSVDFLRGDFTRLYGLDYDAFNLLVFDTAKGTSEIVGSAHPLTGHVWTGLTGDPTDNTLYASSSDGITSELYRLDPSSGEAAWLGTVGSELLVIDIAVSAGGQMYGLDIRSDNLLSIDKTTGRGEAVGPVGFDANFAQGMDFDDSSGTLYLAAYNNETFQGELRVADTLTGNTALVGQFAGGTEMCMAVAAEAGGCAWARLSTNAVTLPAGGAGSLRVFFDARNVTRAGEYNGHLSFAGNFANEPPDLPLTMIVPSDALRIHPEAALRLAGQSGGPFIPSGGSYTLANDGTASVAWALTQTASWLDPSSTGGVLRSQAETNVAVTVNATGLFLEEGEYTNIISFHNKTDGTVQRRAAAVEVLAFLAQPFLCFDLDSDPGWTTEGEWDFGIPTGTGGSCENPSSGHTGDNVYGYNLSGNYADNSPRHYLTTAPLDCSGHKNVRLSFWRRLGVESAIFDEANIEVSNDGLEWTEIWAHSDSSLCDRDWQHVTYDISAVADMQPAVRIRWGMGPTDSSVTYPGWNIDDICLSGNLISGGCGVIISEYLHASRSGDRAVEIYNGTEGRIDLAREGYFLQGYHDGSAVASYSVALTGTVSGAGAYVIVFDGSQAAVRAMADQLTVDMAFTGDDALVLRKGGTEGPVLDVFGQVGFDPGSYWGTSPNITAGRDMRRRSAVVEGDTVSTDPFDPSIEWEFYPSDAWDGLGEHTMDCECLLEVISAYGRADPPAGTYAYPLGTELTCSVTDPVIQHRAMQIVADGWAGSGKFSMRGAGVSTGPFRLTVPSSIEWLWWTNYWLNVETAGNGDLDVEDGWFRRGSNVIITAFPAEYHHLEAWSGDTNGCERSGDRITVPMERTRDIVAEFSATLAPLGTPEWWLARHGLDQDAFAVEELKDTDGDGMPAWAEFIADTIPTNAASVLRISDLSTRQGGARVGWMGGVEARQFLERRRNLDGEAPPWTAIFTNDPPTTPATNFTDLSATNRTGFYRIRAERGPPGQ